MEQDIVSVERINQFSNNEFEQEQPVKNKEEELIPIKWPNNGRIQLKDIYMRYRENLPLVLNGLTFTVNAGEKIGIIGRTGAGKSSLFRTLLRLIETERGNIYIDDINISSVPLQTLRSKISIIPQAPVLFSGNIRFNLDPFNATTMSLEEFLNEYGCNHLLKKLKKIGICNVDKLRDTEIKNDIFNDKELKDINSMKMVLTNYDNDLIEALKVSHCYELLWNNKNRENEDENVLNILVDENGDNFSVGEKQLICLSRAIVRKSSILLLDEATSSVDAETDRLIQETIRKVFENKTILTIAHRIDTILDYDRILIMEQGKVSQYDSPKNLLSDTNGTFSQIVQEAFGVDIKSVQSYLNQNNAAINLKACENTSVAVV